MKSHVRVAAVAAASAHANTQIVSAVYDHSRGVNISVSASVTGDTISAYDYESGCHFGGTMPTLYHYGVGSHFTLNASPGGIYNGYDFDTGQHFRISVSGKTVQCYDFGEAAYFTYSTL